MWRIEMTKHEIVAVFKCTKMMSIVQAYTFTAFSGLRNS